MGEKTKGSKIMKNITKIIALVLVLCMVFAGCGKKDEQTKGSVTVGDYTGFKITKVNVVVTEEDVNSAISSFLSDNKLETPVTEEGAARGNKVVIDFEGLIDGEAFSGGTATDYTLTSLGYGSFIDGFEESIIGKKAGESYSVDLKFPDDYGSTDLAGKDVTFNITVKSVAIVTIPEYNDETVRVTAGYDSTAEFEEYLRNQIAAEREEEAILLQEEELWAQLLEVSEVTSWPQAEIDAYVDEMTAYFQAYAEMFGMSYGDFLATYTSLGSEAEAEQYMIEEAKLMIKNSLIIAYIVEKNNLTYTEAEYNDFVNGYATANGMTANDVVTNYAAEEIAEAVYYQKVIELLRATAVEVDAAE